MDSGNGVVPVMDLNANRNYDGFGYGGGGMFAWVIALMFMFAGGGMWGNNWNNGAVTQSDIFLNGNATRNEINNGFNHAETQADVRTLNAQIVDGMHENIITSLREMNGISRDILISQANAQRDLLGGFNNLQMFMCQNTHEITDNIVRNGFGTQQAIDNLRAEQYRNTCDITSAIKAQAEETRALIVQNQIAELRDRLADKDRNIVSLQGQLSTNAQTQALLAAIAANGGAAAAKTTA